MCFRRDGFKKLSVGCNPGHDAKGTDVNQQQIKGQEKYTGDEISTALIAS